MLKSHFTEHIITGPTPHNTRSRQNVYHHKSIGDEEVATTGNVSSHKNERRCIQQQQQIAKCGFSTLSFKFKVILQCFSEQLVRVMIWFL
jgi:hypothetical protein